mmetsp:Transcript_130095/g.308644  ORF Transcript_130095/g.308644 Transcript_130095/m.308644 type:complete len:254 (+) Transcript_130095:912-1673(+)
MDGIGIIALVDGRVRQHVIQGICPLLRAIVAKLVASRSSIVLGLAGVALGPVARLAVDAHQGLVGDALSAGSPGCGACAGGSGGGRSSCSLRGACGGRSRAGTSSAAARHNLNVSAVPELLATATASAACVLPCGRTAAGFEPVGRRVAVLAQDLCIASVVLARRAAIRAPPPPLQGAVLALQVGRHLEADFVHVAAIGAKAAWRQVEALRVARVQRLAARALVVWNASEAQLLFARTLQDERIQTALRIGQA